MCDQSDQLPPCDSIVKAYLVHAIGIAAMINSAQTEYYKRRREGVDVTVISSPIFPQRLLARIVVWLFMFVPLLLLLVILGGWMFALWLGWSYFKDHLQDPALRIVAMVILFVVGVAICAAKQRYQSFAGFAEIEVGLVACWVGLGKITDPEAGAVYSIAAGVYLIARGAENIYVGRKKVKAIWREYQTALKWARMFR